LYDDGENRDREHRCLFQLPRRRNWWYGVQMEECERSSKRIEIAVNG
jgi:hypothetical protein